MPETERSGERNSASAHLRIRQNIRGPAVSRTMQSRLSFNRRVTIPLPHFAAVDKLGRIAPLRENRFDKLVFSRLPHKCHQLQTCYFHTLLILFFFFLTDSPIPFIQCPGNMAVTLPLQEKTAYVTFSQPKSNMDWFR